MDAKGGALNHSPDPVPSYGVTDEQLAAELKKSAGKRPVHHPVGELLDRHWEAAFSYARLCTDGAHPAGMLTTAAFTRLFEDSARQGGPTAAWRPQLLVAIRRLAAEWDTDHRRELLHPVLRSDPALGERAAARLLPPGNRRLVSRAFPRLAEPARCLLWHVEVEREEVTLPAALLGIDAGDAEVRLERAREQLREACLDVHRESAPDEECRRYVRLLDVSLRRENPVLDPDLRLHMDGCAHCHHAAEQLEGFRARLPLLLAEGVLGWGAQAYLDDAAARTRAAEPVPAAPVGGEPLVDPADAHRRFAPEPPADPADAYGRFAPEPPADSADAYRRFALQPEPSADAGYRPATDVPGSDPGRATRATPAASAGLGPRSAGAHKAPRRSPQRRQLVLAVATVSALILLPLAVWSVAHSAGGAPSATAAPSDEPSPGARASASGSPSWVGAAAEVPTGAFRGRLRNQDSGLCIGLDRKQAAAGAEAVLVSCATSATQQWAYETDGLLRSVAAPGLCLDSHLGYSAQLAPCVGQSRPESKNVRYDFTVQGAIVLRWNQDLALTPASPATGAGLVVKPRTEDGTQHWLTDTPNSLRMQSVNWGRDAETATPTAPSAAPSRTTTPTTHGAPKPAPTPARPTPGTSRPSSPGGGACSSPDCAPNGPGGYGGWGGYGGYGGYGGWGPYGGGGGRR
ncbi:ricin-type beta-trefoil lectin domain protein [Streptomyces sp. NPDC058960]|uniref:ricin-type beta-trefoil lectin domain protein n=1 Tax=Streptomyces sp. NPDC058960 TaxID=3346679 RepID=UPI00367C8A8B